MHRHVGPRTEVGLVTRQEVVVAAAAAAVRVHHLSDLEGGEGGAVAAQAVPDERSAAAGLHVQPLAGRRLRAEPAAQRGREAGSAGRRPHRRHPLGTGRLPRPLLRPAKALLLLVCPREVVGRSLLQLDEHVVEVLEHAVRLGLAEAVRRAQLEQLLGVHRDRLERVHLATAATAAVKRPDQPAARRLRQQVQLPQKMAKLDRVAEVLSAHVDLVEALREDDLAGEISHGVDERRLAGLGVPRHQRYLSGLGVDGSAACVAEDDGLDLVGAAAGVAEEGDVLFGRVRADLRGEPEAWQPVHLKGNHSRRQLLWSDSPGRDTTSSRMKCRVGTYVFSKVIAGSAGTPSKLVGQERLSPRFYPCNVMG